MSENSEVVREAARAAKELIAEAAVKAANILEDAAVHVVNIKVMANDLNYMRKDIAEIKTVLENKFVTKAEFTPVKWIIFGLVSLILTGVVGALISLVILK